MCFSPANFRVGVEMDNKDIPEEASVFPLLYELLRNQDSV
jgi:hypothetical protein